MPRCQVAHDKLAARLEGLQDSLQLAKLGSKEAQAREREAQERLQAAELKLAAASKTLEESRVRQAGVTGWPHKGICLLSSDCVQHIFVHCHCHSHIEHMRSITHASYPVL